VPEPVIDARALTKAYGLLPVLRGVDLTVETGESVAILGPNGAGKSTLLRILAGIARPAGGSLRLFGANCFPDRPGRATLARIGFVGHEPLVYRDLTARENLEHYARMYGLGNDHGTPRNGAASGTSAVAVAAGALERAELEGVAGRLARNLSRGMLQRLALARATLHRPDLLLLDEPFSGLDEHSSELLTASLRRAREAGVTSVLVTHDLARLAALASRVLVLESGRFCLDRAPTPPAEELTRIYRSATGLGDDDRVGNRP